MTIHEFIEENRAAMVSDIIDLVNIPTVYSEDADSGQPFGKEVDRGLKWILDRAEVMGMETKDFDGYAGEITAGDGPFMIGVLAHEDVVPAGEGWETDPFDAVVKDGAIYGRGTGDDKGPLISSLYAMKYLMDEGKIPAGTCLRMIVGTNEEEGWGGINYYKSQAEKLPDYSIVPDGYFPLIYCEKGLVDFDLKISLLDDKSAEVKVDGLYGGSGRNVVAGKAGCDLNCPPNRAEEIAAALNTFEGVTTTRNGSVIEVTAQGKSTHAMSPEKGLNAISVLMKSLASIDCTLSLGDLVDKYNRYIGMDYNAEKFGCGFEDQLSGKTTFNIGVLRYEENTAVLEANLRYPASLPKETIKQAVEKTCDEAGFVYAEKDYLPPVYTEPDSDFVGKLMEVYRRVTRDEENEAFTIGGATYARAIPNAVAFGPLFPYEEELAHEANEFLSIDSLEKMTWIFAEGLEALLGMKK